MLCGERGSLSNFLIIFSGFSDCKFAKVMNMKKNKKNKRLKTSYFYVYRASHALIYILCERLINSISFGTLNENFVYNRRYESGGVDYTKTKFILNLYGSAFRCWYNGKF